MSNGIIGMTKEEVLQTMHGLDATTYQAKLNALSVELKINPTPAKIESFFSRYSDEILYPFVSELVEANNKKVTEDVKKLLSK